MADRDDLDYFMEHAILSKDLRDLADRARAIRDRERKLLTAYRAAIKAADEMRRCYSEVWSGNHEAPSIVAYSRARAEIGE